MNGAERRMIRSFRPKATVGNQPGLQPGGGSSPGQVVLFGNRNNNQKLSARLPETRTFATKWEEFVATKPSVHEQSKEQDRWNRLGTKQVEAIRKEPEKHIVNNSPISWLAGSGELLKLISPPKGKRILELGCGWGRSAVFLAHQGAKVTGVDIGPDLIAASKALAQINHVECDFQVANIVSLPFESQSYDCVIGMTILHHLSKPDVSLALAEASRVLKDSGMAVFIEPVENSRVFDFIQNLFPAGERGSGWYRPSILQRPAWNDYVGSRDNRVLTTRELISEGKKHFRSLRTSPYGFLVRLERLTGGRYRKTLQRLDDAMFGLFPPLGYLSQTVLVEYRK